MITRNTAWFDQNAFYQIRPVDTIKTIFLSVPIYKL